MAYQLAGNCKECGAAYQQISGIDMAPAEQRTSNCYYSCPSCGSAEFSMAPLLKWDITERSE